MATSGAAGSDLNLSFGPLLIGLIADAVLYGVLVLQSYWYWRGELRGSRGLDILVSVLWFLDSFQLVLASHAVYHFLVSSFGNYAALENSVWSLDLEVAPTVLVTFLVRLFFTIRLWHLSGKNKWLIGTILVFAAAQLCIGFYMCIISFLETRFNLLPNYLVCLSLQLAVSVAEDILITGPLIYYLEYSRTGINKTDSLIDTLITWTVNTALLTGVVELGQLIVWTALPKTLLFLPFHLLVAKLYTNSMLAMLNGRAALRHEAQSTTWITQAGQTSSLLIEPVRTQTSTMSFPPPMELRVDINAHRRRPYAAPLSPSTSRSGEEFRDSRPPGLADRESHREVEAESREHRDSDTGKDSVQDDIVLPVLTA